MWLAGLCAVASQGVLLVLLNGSVPDGIVNELANARNQSFSKVKGRGNTEAAKLLPDVDIVHDTRRVDGEVVERRRDLSRQQVGGRSVLLRGYSLRDAQLLDEGLDGARLVLGVEQELVGGVHGCHEASQQGIFSLVAQGGLADGEGARGDGGDDVGDAGEDVGGLAGSKSIALDGKGVGEDGGIDCGAVGESLVDEGGESLGSSADGLTLQRVSFVVQLLSLPRCSAQLTIK